MHYMLMVEHLDSRRKYEKLFLFNVWNADRACKEGNSLDAAPWLPLDMVVAVPESPAWHRENLGLPSPALRCSGGCRVAG